ncbi:MAG: ATP-binding protein [Pseudomonadota bacterium]
MNYPNALRHTPYLTHLCLYLLLLLSVSTPAEAPLPGLPPIIHYDAKIKGAFNGVYDAIQDDQGIMYFALNDHGIVSYDGVRWRQVQIPESSRAILPWHFAKGVDGQIYVGATADFGYLAPTPQGQMQYVSLLEHVPPEQRDFTPTNLLKIHATPQGVYFQTTSALFRWQPDSQTMKVWEAEEGTFFWSWWINGRLYVRQPGRGLLHLEADKLELAPAGESLADARMRVMLPYDEQRFLLRAFQRFFLYDGEQLVPFEIDAPQLAQNVITDSVVLPSGHFAFGTTAQGVFIIDRQGQLVRHLGHHTGLTSNFIWSLYLASDGALWVSGHEGAFRVDISAPLTIYRGATSYSIQHQDKFYSTMKGRMAYWDAVSQSFRYFGQTVGVSHQMRDINGQLMVANFQGLYRVEQQQLLPMLEQEIGRKIVYFLHPAARDNTLVFIAAAQGLVLMRQQADGHWRGAGTVPSLDNSIFQIAEDEQHRLWLSGDGVVYQLSFPAWPSLEGPVIRQFELIPDLSINSLFFHIAFIEGQIFSMSDYGLFRWDEVAEQFIRDRRFGEDTAYITPSLDGRFWVSSPGRLNTALAIPQEDGTYQLESAPFRLIADNVVWHVLSNPDNQQVWFSTFDGVIRYDRSIASTTPSVFKTLLRRVNQGDRLLYGGDRPLLNNQQSFAHDENNFQFEYAAPAIGYEQDTRYQTRLIGFDADWSDWQKKADIRYTNLSPGNYQFQVRARNLFEQESKSEVFAFTIAEPWYQRPWAYLLYVIVAVCIVFGVVRRQTARLRQQRTALEQIVEERTHDIQVEKERAEAARIDAEVARTEAEADRASAEKAQIEAENANRAKSTFLANMSHELRTPLNAILGFTQLMQRDSRMPEEQSKNLGIVNRSGEHLLSLINDVLDMAKIEAGHTELMLEPFDLYRLLDSLEDMLRVRTEGKKIELLFEVKDIPHYVKTDESKLQQILINLMGNAIKFTNEGSVTLQANSPQKNRLIFEIGDTGAGIAADELDKLFEAFSQTESGEQSKEGTGLGLAISRQFVQMMNGDITVESRNVGELITLMEVISTCYDHRC